MARRFDHLADVEAFVTVTDEGSMTYDPVVRPITLRDLLLDGKTTR